MTERKLATIRRISALDPIPGADKIEVATVDGWRVVVKKGEFQVGMLAVYIEVDSWVPTAVAPFLTKPGHAPKEFEGIAGERLRTVKLRGQLSQGLLLPVILRQGMDYNAFTVADVFITGDPTEGQDVTAELGILKWEKPIPANMQGVMRGNFPTKLKKTDQPRIQNMSRELPVWNEQSLSWEITEKLHGTSATFWLDEDDQFHVCSRNVDLIEDENNLYWQVAKKYKIEETLRMFGDPVKGLAIQGEICGPGIEGNLYGFEDHKFFVFDLFSSIDGSYCDVANRHGIVKALGLDHVPVLGFAVFKGTTVTELLEQAKGDSVFNDVEREGLVFKCVTDSNISFKSINNDWLMKHE